jgi:hypothetical protein
MIAISETKELQIIEQKTTDIVLAANKMVITNQEQYDLCSVFIVGIKELMRQVDETFDKNIADAYALHKSLVATKKKHSDPLKEAEAIVKGKSIAWIEEQRRKEEESQRKAEEEAAKAEAKRKADLEEQAKAWEAKGNVAKAEERRAMADQVIVPVKDVQPTFTQAQGQTVRSSWKCEVIDMVALCRLIADGVLPPIMVQPNQSKLDGLARTMTNTKNYPGLKFTEEKTLSVRR